MAPPQDLEKIGEEGFFLLGNLAPRKGRKRTQAHLKKIGEEGFCLLENLAPRKGTKPTQGASGTNKKGT